jgi:hypothetical protein
MDEMARIPGIRSEMARAYGSTFLKILRNLEDAFNLPTCQDRPGPRRNLQAHAPTNERHRPHDPNHETVIDLISDNEEKQGGNDEFDDVAFDDDEDDDAEPSEASHFFAKPRATSAAQVQSAAGREFMNRFDSLMPPVPKTRELPWKGPQKQSRYGNTDWKEKQKYPSNYSSRTLHGSRGAGKVVKKKSRRSSGSDSWPRAPKSKKKADGGQRGIGQMPT